MQPDWTVPFDDILTTRFRTCQWCSQPADELDLWSGPSGEAITVAMCRRCRDADPQGTRRNALVEQHAQQRRGTGG
jgi:hypothetical protein